MKIFLFSILLSLFVLFSLNAYQPENVLSGTATAAIDLTGGERSFASFTAGLLIQYFILLAAVYFFLRGVAKSFGK